MRIRQLFNRATAHQVRVEVPLLKRECRGDGVSDDSTAEEGGVTIEHTHSGVGMPDWLVQQICAEALSPTSQDESDSPKTSHRLMAIHGSDASRRQSVEQIAALSRTGLDPTQFQTIDRLIDALHVDLRLPRMMAEDGTTALLVHASCVNAAAELAFPLLHPVAERMWPLSMTQRLTQLHSTLAEEDPNFTWEGDPGLAEYSQVLDTLEEKVERIHPATRLRRVVDELHLWADAKKVPFTLANFDGIIVLDQSPSLSWLRRQFLLAISRFTPLHQISHAGKFRLGEHGAWLEDIGVCRTAESLPKQFIADGRAPWRSPEEVPWWFSDENDERSAVHRVKLGRSEHDFTATLALIDAFESDVARQNGIDDSANIIIADAALATRRGKWSQALAERAYDVAANEEALAANPAVHWVLELAGLAIGEEAWSLNRLRALAVQKTLTFKHDFFNGDQHPTDKKIRARGHVRILQDVARSHHILGGNQALNRWLAALDSWRPDPLMVGYDKVMLALEETQWWVRNLAQSQRPLLDEDDIIALDEFGQMKGAVSGVSLPLSIAAGDGNAWLSELLSNLNWPSLISAGDGCVAGLQRLLELVQRSDEMFSAAEYERQTSGVGWVEELQVVISDSVIPTRRTDAKIRLLTPAASLGCNADLVIICGMSSTEWSMREPSTPWLDDETKLDLGILRPSSALCDARHHLRHLLNCGEVVVVLDPSSDPDKQPSAPFSEWLNNLSIEERSIISAPPAFIVESDWDVGRPERVWDFIEGDDAQPHLVSRPAAVSISSKGVRSDVNSLRWRNKRHNDGLAIVEGRQAQSKPLAPTSVAHGWSKEMMSDRFSREPQAPNQDELWVGQSAHSRLVTMHRQKLDPGKKWPEKRKKLREATTWPALTGRPSPRSIIPAIDARPLLPKSVAIDSYDTQHGEDSKLKLKSQVWSASRLKSWLDCPRKGWLERHLRAGKDDDLREGLDARTRGTLYHDSLAHLICEKLGFEVGEVRSKYEHANLSKTKIAPQVLMSDLVGIVLASAPWLCRGDAVAEQRRRELLAMNAAEIENFIAKPKRLELEGAIGRLLAAELELQDSSIIALEAPLHEGDNDHVKIELSSSPDLAGKSKKIGQIDVMGRIDRVEILWNTNSSSWVDEAGSDEVCPLDLDHDKEWRPKRLVIIRDLKTVKGPESGDVGSRHRSALFEEVQLALYARAWELMNPGDRVVGVGITEAGETVHHFIEFDATMQEVTPTENLGNLTQFTSLLFRREGEGASPKSNPFRAWLRQRLTVAIAAAAAAADGQTRPTPSKDSCSYCGVKNSCPLGEMFTGGI